MQNLNKANEWISILHVWQWKYYSVGRGNNSRLGFTSLRPAPLHQIWRSWKMSFTIFWSNSTNYRSIIHFPRRSATSFWTYFMNSLYFSQFCPINLIELRPLNGNRVPATLLHLSKTAYVVWLKSVKTGFESDKIYQLSAIIP